MLNSPSGSKQASPQTTAPKKPQIWAVASGKGGVGKSFVAANLSMALAEQGKKTVLVDLDLGGANTHTCLGITDPKTTLSDILLHHSPIINDMVEYHDNPKLGLISGASDHLQMANLKHFQKLKIMRHLSHLDADYVILDLGSGTSFNTLDFFLFADQALLTIVPEPTSVENSYRFIKCLLARTLKSLPEKTQRIMNHVLTQQKNTTGKAQSFAYFCAEMDVSHPEHGLLIRDNLKKLNLNLIVNQVLEPSDIKLGNAMEVIFRKYFDLNINLMGYLYHDAHVIQSLKQKQAYYHHYPQSRNATCLNRMATTLISKTMHHEPSTLDTAK